MLRKSSNSVKVCCPEIDRERLVSILKDRIRDLSEKIRIRIVILFGSYAANRHTPASDIDLLIVVEEEDKDKAYREILRFLKISNLQLHLYTVREYEKMRENRPLFIKEIEGKGIPILIR